MRRKAGREQEAPFFYGTKKLVRERLLRSLSYAGDSKKKEYEYFFFLESGVSNLASQVFSYRRP